MKSFSAREINNGITEDTHFTNDGGMHQTFTQDITKLLDDNKNARNNTSDWIKIRS